MDITIVIEKMIMLFLIMMIGYAARKARVFDDRAVGNFSSLVVNVTMPCLMLSSISIESDISKTEVLLFLAVAVLMFGGLALFAKLVPHLLKADASESGVFEYMTMFSNNGFMGFPVIQAILGREALLLASVLNLPINIMMFSYGVYLITKDGRQEQQFNWKRLINPGMVAGVTALSLYLLDFSWPAVAGDVFSTAGDVTTPLAMIVLGASLADVPIGEVLRDWRIYIFSTIRLIVEPFLVWLVVSRIFDNPLIWGVLVITAGMPCATATVMICTEYGKNAATASKHVFMSTVFSVVTIPLLAWLLFS